MVPKIALRHQFNQLKPRGVRNIDVKAVKQDSPVIKKSRSWKFDFEEFH
jgi:hypothetical protein